MKFVQTMCIALLIVQSAAQFACAQESADFDAFRKAQATGAQTASAAKP